MKAEAGSRGGIRLREDSAAIPGIDSGSLGNVDKPNVVRSDSGTPPCVSSTSTSRISPWNAVLSLSSTRAVWPMLARSRSSGCVQDTSFSIVLRIVSQPAVMLTMRPFSVVAQNDPSTAASGTSSQKMSPSLSASAVPCLTTR